ncbi:MAG: thiamine pyrophosphate-dependent enzyme [Candidatus Helarchaeota archaeon]
MVNSAILTSELDKKVLMIGNEAMIRGSLEANVQFVSQYPGTPLSDMGLVFGDLMKSGRVPGLYFQWAANEAAAMQAAAGASWCGIRSLVPAKHVGINVLADSLGVIALNGPTSSRGEGGLVVIAGGDPASLGSHCEQNDRFYSWMLHLCHVEPSDVQECLDWMPLMFDISQEYDLVGYFRVTSRISHSRQDVTIRKKFPKFEPKKGYFKKDIPKFCSLPPHCINNHARLYDRMDELGQSKHARIFNKILQGDARTGIITGGVPFNYIMEALRILGLNDIPILKYGMINPIDKNIFKEFSADLEKIIIVEELEPFIEVKVKQMAQEMGFSIPILGQEIVRKWGELSVGDLIQILGKEFNRPIASTTREILNRYEKYLPMIPSRPPTFCAGCPERALLYAIKKATDENNTIYAGDIGCYVMSFFPPMGITDWVICMSGGLGAAIGASMKTDQPVIALMGDSTFYHTGLPILISAVYNGANVILIILDNSWTAMTGGHENPNTPPALRKANILENPVKFDMASILRACGVKWVKAVDPYQPKAMIAAIQSALKQKGLRVIISRRECGLQYGKRLKKELQACIQAGQPFSRKVFQVIPERCELCRECTQQLCCTALRIMTIDGRETVYIDEARCNQCGVCAAICPNGAIMKTEIDVHYPNIKA